MEPSQAPSDVRDCFLAVRSRTRKSGWAVQTPRWIPWRLDPDHTFGWFRTRRLAQETADLHNRALPAYREAARKHPGGAKHAA